MSLEFYRLVHFAGIFLTFLALGGLSLRAMTGGGDDALARKVALASHGFGLLLVLVGGFGGLARLGGQWGTWTYVKLAIWVTLGVAVIVPKRFPKASLALWALLPVLGLIAAAAARMKW